MKTVTIGVMCDGFSITIDDCTYYIDQEEDPTPKLEKLFKSLGFKVEVEEHY